MTDDFSLDSLEPDNKTQKKSVPKDRVAGKSAPKPKVGDEPEIISYRHGEKSKSNPEAGMVTSDTDPDEGLICRAYDSHLDTTLQFDGTRSRMELLINEALDGLNQKDNEILAQIDHALAGQDERAVREVLENLRKRVAAGLDGSTIRSSLEELKRI